MPQPQLDDKQYVLLSSLDETILQDAKKIQLSTHRYPNTYHPEGYHYYEEFSYERIPQWIIKSSDIELKKEVMLAENEERIFIRYTIVESKKNVRITIQPFSCFQKHSCDGQVQQSCEQKNRKSTQWNKTKNVYGFF